MNTRDYRLDFGGPLRPAQAPDKPHPSFNRLSRYDCTGLVWLLEGRSVSAIAEATAMVKSKTGNITAYRKHNALGSLGDSLEDFVHPPR